MRSALFLSMLLLLLTVTACGGPETESPGELVVYSGRNERLIGPLLDRFTEQTGIVVSRRYGGTSELTATLLEEGDATPADLFLSQDAAALGALSGAGLLQPLTEELLAVVPSNFRSSAGDWIGLSGRARVIVYNTELIDPMALPGILDEVMDERFRGKFGVAPGNASFQAHIAVYLAIHGEAKTREAAAILRDSGTPCLIHQPSYSMLNRWIEEEGLLDVVEAEGMGVIAFSPLAQGMLTGKYLDGVPSDSRAAEDASLSKSFLNQDNLMRLRALNEVAGGRGQTLAQMAIAWVLRDPRVTTALIGASRWSQIEDSLGALDHLGFTDDELTEINRFANDGGIDLWVNSSSES